MPSLWALEELDPRGAVLPSVEGPAMPAIDLDGLERDAYSRGFAEGHLTGERAESERLQPVLRALNEALMTLQDEADLWIGNAQENVCALAVAVARQILGREVQANSETIRSLISQALLEFPLDQPVIVRLHAADHAAIVALKGTASIPGSDRTDVQWVADPRVERGGCVLEGRDRILDGRIDVALERLYRRLTLTDA